MSYPTYKGVSSWQAWSRTKSPSKGSYTNFMTAPSGGTSGWQNYMRGGTPGSAAKASVTSNPAFGVAYNAANAHLADQGMLSSTAAAGTLSTAKATDAYNNQNLAQKWFETLYSGALGRASIAQSSKGVVFPTLPTGINDMIAKMFLPPSASTGATGDPIPPAASDGPVGDSMMTGQKAAAGGGVTFDLPFYQRTRDAATDSQNNARIDIARQQLAQQATASQRSYELQKAAYDKSAAPADIWAAMTQTAGLNLQAANSTDAATRSQALLPTGLMNAFNAQYGVDVLGVAKDKKDPNNARALALIKMMYPGGSWTKFFGGAKAAPAHAASPLASPVSQGYGTRDYNNLFSTPSSYGSKESGAPQTSTAGIFNGILNWLNRGF